MNRVQIISPGMESTIQDGGRKGYMFYGIPQSGFLDRQSAHLANLLVGNELDAPLIECSYQGITASFSASCLIAITGANMSWKIDGEPIERNKSLSISAGQILKGGYARSGFRGYLSISGDMANLQKHHHSYSTYMYAGLGGLDGTKLKKGDQLDIESKPNNIRVNVELSSVNLDVDLISIYPGPEFDILSQESQTSLFQQSFQITSESNRMGARLHSTIPLYTCSKSAARSNPIIPGTIQLLPSGQLIVILQDGQTTGGYPRVAFIPSSTLSLFNQIRPKLSFRFLKAK